MHRKAGTNFYDAGDLGIKLRFIGDIHRRVLGPYRVKRLVGKRQMQGIPATVVHQVIESHAFGQQRGNPAVALRNVYPGYMASVGRRKKTRWPSESGTYVQN